MQLLWVGEVSSAQHEEQLQVQMTPYTLPAITVHLCKNIRSMNTLQKKNLFKKIEEVDECHYNVIKVNWYNDTYERITMEVSSFLFLMSWSCFCEYCWDAGVYAAPLTGSGQTEMLIIPNLARAENY